jgi:hypothetical protein
VLNLIKANFVDRGELADMRREIYIPSTVHKHKSAAHAKSCLSSSLEFIMRSVEKKMMSPKYAIPVKELRIIGSVGAVIILSEGAA